MMFIAESGRMGTVKDMAFTLGLMVIVTKVSGKTHLRMAKEQTYYQTGINTKETIVMACRTVKDNIDGKMVLCSVEILKMDLDMAKVNGKNLISLKAINMKVSLKMTRSMGMVHLCGSQAICIVECIKMI